MGLLDRFKKWLEENEGEFKDSSDKATKFIEDLGREIGYTGSRVAKSAEEAIRKFDEEFSKKSKDDSAATEPTDTSYAQQPKTSTSDNEYFDEEENNSPEEDAIEETEKDVSNVEKLMDNIDELISELKKQEEEDIPDPRDHKTAIEQDWKGMDDDFIKKATRFADRELSRSSENTKKGTSKGENVKGFEDKDQDGDPIIDDAEIDDSE